MTELGCNLSSKIRRKKRLLSLRAVVRVVQGPRMVRDVFRLAKENAPAIIFIDEVDAIATARFDAQTGADREVRLIIPESISPRAGCSLLDNVQRRKRQFRRELLFAHSDTNRRV
jgi:hypothetical protein